jgi:hypothetical protein
MVSAVNNLTPSFLGGVGTELLLSVFKSSAVFGDCFTSTMFD